LALGRFRRMRSNAPSFVTQSLSTDTCQLRC
jgi:hypothetical protein